MYAIRSYYAREGALTGVGVSRVVVGPSDGELIKMSALLPASVTGTAAEVGAGVEVTRTRELLSESFTDGKEKLHPVRSTEKQHTMLSVLQYFIRNLSIINGRITSYNVCYTKLLRLLLGAYAGAFSRAVRLLKGLLKISILLFIIQILIIQSGDVLISLPFSYNFV